MRRKCERKGHLLVIESRRGYRRPQTWSFRVIAEAVLQERFTCSRWFCNYTEEWQDAQVKELQGLTLNSDVMEQLEKEGVVWTRSH